MRGYTPLCKLKLKDSWERRPAERKREKEKERERKERETANISFDRESERFANEPSHRSHRAD